MLLKQGAEAGAAGVAERAVQRAKSAASPAARLPVPTSSFS